MTRQFRHRAGLLAAWLAVGALGAGCDINVGDGGFNIGLATSKAVDTWTRTYTVADGGSFEVVNGNGAIEASQGTGPTVEVRAERTAKASTDEAAKALLARSKSSRPSNRIRSASRRRRRRRSARAAPR